MPAAGLLVVLVVGPRATCYACGGQMILSRIGLGTSSSRAVVVSGIGGATSPKPPPLWLLRGETP